MANFLYAVEGSFSLQGKVRPSCNSLCVFAPLRDSFFLWKNSKPAFEQASRKDAKAQRKRTIRNERARLRQERATRAPLRTFLKNRQTLIYQDCPSGRD